MVYFDDLNHLGDHIISGERKRTTNFTISGEEPMVRKNKPPKRGKTSVIV